MSDHQHSATRPFSGNGNQTMLGPDCTTSKRLDTSSTTNVQRPHQQSSSRWGQYLRNCLAIAVLLGVYWMTRLPQLSPADRTRLADQFTFQAYPLPELPGPEVRTIRPVHPALQHIAGWISSVGAAVSLSDLDRDGRPNDVCYVDTRTDQVIVGPIPGTGDRFQPFTLDAGNRFQRETMAPMGCVPCDLNEDGWLDVLVYYWGRTPIIFLQQRDLPVDVNTTDSQPLSDQRFVPCELDSSGARWYTNAATCADIDGDGHVDILVGNYFQDAARVLDVDATGSQHMHHSMSRSLNGGRNRLFLWQASESGEGRVPDVQFREAHDIWDDDVAHGWTLAIGAADVDGDLLPEIYFSNDFGHDRLLHNRSRPGKPQFDLLVGEKRFTTPNSKVLGRDSFKGMGVDFGDVNGDGRLDIYVSNIAKPFALEESHFLFMGTGQFDRMSEGIAPFVERSEALGLSRSGWGWESRLADFNNDGQLEAIQATGFVKGDRNRWPQLHEAAMGNDLLLRYPSQWHRVQSGDDLSGHEHNPFFVRAEDGRFYDLAQEIGLDRPHVTRGIATADIDGDGDLDFALANQWQRSLFYRNDSASHGAFLGLRLLLPTDDRNTWRVAAGQVAARATRHAIGASATLRLPSGRVLTAQVDGGNGHSGVRSPELHFGLGKLSHNRPVRVELRWRDTAGQVQMRNIQLTAGWHTIVLGGPNAELVRR